MYVENADEHEKDTSLSYALVEEEEDNERRKKYLKKHRRQTAADVRQLVDSTRMYLNMFVKFLQKQSYLLSLLSMMVIIICFDKVM